MTNGYSCEGFSEGSEELEESLDVYIRFSVVGELTGQNNIFGFVTLGRIDPIDTDLLGMPHCFLTSDSDHGYLSPETQAFLGIPEINDVFPGYSER